MKGLYQVLPNFCLIGQAEAPSILEEYCCKIYPGTGVSIIEVGTGILPITADTFVPLDAAILIKKLLNVIKTVLESRNILPLISNSVGSSELKKFLSKWQQI